MEFQKSAFLYYKKKRNGDSKNCKSQQLLAVRNHIK